MSGRCSETIEYHPSMAGHLICVALSGLIRAEDHERCLAEPVRQARERFGRYRILIEFKPGFRGWEPEAADLNLRVIIECAQDCERAAYVNPPAGKILQMKLAPSLIGGQIRFFETEELPEALAWLHE